jgi:hypothetical protein
LPFSFPKNTCLSQKIYFLGQPDFLFLKGTTSFSRQIFFFILVSFPKNVFFGKETRRPTSKKPSKSVSKNKTL